MSHFPQAIQRARRARTQPVRAVLIINPVSGNREPNTSTISALEHGHPLGQTPVMLRVMPRELRVFAPKTPLHTRNPDPPAGLPDGAGNRVSPSERESVVAAYV